MNEVYVSTVAGEETRSLTRAIDRNIQFAKWMPGGKELLVGADDGVGVALWIQHLNGGSTRIDLGGLVPSTSNVAIGPRGELAFTASLSDKPPELYWLPAIGAEPKTLTHLNSAIGELALGRIEAVSWKSDGMLADGVLTYPPGFSARKKYPLVLDIHGGPHTSSKAVFSVLPQLLAAQGWLVFEPNYRGSDNLGNHFQAAMAMGVSVGAGRDIMAGVKMLIGRGLIDTQKIAVSGWSAGGLLTLWLLGQYPDTWRAAVAGAAPTDWIDQYSLSDANVRNGIYFGGSPWTNSSRMRTYVSQSPLSYASKVTAPTLLLSNTRDYRVPIVQSYKFFHALRDRGVNTQLIAYPSSGHFPSDPVHARDVNRRWIEWLRRYLAEAEPFTGTKAVSR